MVFWGLDVLGSDFPTRAQLCENLDMDFYMKPCYVVSPPIMMDVNSNTRPSTMNSIPSPSHQTDIGLSFLISSKSLD